MSNNLIKNSDKGLVVPNNPVIPYIEGDGIGVDIWPVAEHVFNEAVKAAYGDDRKITWLEVLAGEKAYDKGLGWLPDNTLDTFKKHLVGIKGPLTTPIGGGIRSLNVALRQELDLFACVRPVRYFEGVVTPVKHPEYVDMVIFRENTEDIYAGIEWEAYGDDVKKVVDFLQKEMGVNKIRFPESSAIGIKPVSEDGSKRLIRAALRYAITYKRKSLTLGHKGNIQKFTEGAFKNWGYELTREPEFRNNVVTWDETQILNIAEKNPNISISDCAKIYEPWFDKLDKDKQNKVIKEVSETLELVPTHGNGKWKEKILVKDSIADILLQQILTRPKEFDVIATLNLNGDYFSDALAAQVGGIGIAPGANINYSTGAAIFEATHGTAPKYAGLNKVNPSSIILSGVMLLEYIGWKEAADLITKGISKAIEQKTVTYDFARLMNNEGMKNVREVSCSDFGEAIISNF